MNRWKNAAVCLSLANLCYLGVWSDLLSYTRADTFFMQAPPTGSHYLAAAANTVTLGAVFMVALAAARLDGSRLALRAARCAFLASLLIPLNGLRSMISSGPAEIAQQVRSPVLASVEKASAVWALAALAGLAVLAVLVQRRGTVRAAKALVLLLFPLVPVTFGQAVWKALTVSRDPFVAGGQAPRFEADGNRRFRVLWIVFDEWDQRITFVDRPATLRLAELDAFRSQSLYATGAYPPSGKTLRSIAALTTGRMVADARPRDAGALSLTFCGFPGASDWSAADTIFGDARRLGLNTAVVGWYLPYCRVLGSELTECRWWPMSSRYSSMGEGLIESAGNQARSLFETVQLSPAGQSAAAAHHARTYRTMLEHAERAAADPSLGFVFTHFPVPHSPHFYDRTSGQFTLANSPVRGYLGSLELVDQTLGRLRGAMQRAGTWDTTTILLTSDHWYRSAKALDGKEDPRVPFLVKFAGRSEGLIYDKPFRAVLARSLLGGCLRGEIDSARKAAEWLDGHRLRDLKADGCATDVTGWEAFP